MPPEQSFNPMNLVMFAMLALIWYFLLIRPQKKKQDDQKKMLTNLQKNDDIVTIGGIHGTIVNVKDKTVVVRVDNNVRIEIDKDAVARINPSKSDTTQG